MHTENFIAGKDASLESTIGNMQEKLERIGFHVEDRSWLNPVDDLEYENNSLADHRLLAAYAKLHPHAA